MGDFPIQVEGSLPTIHPGSDESNADFKTYTSIGGYSGLSPASKASIVPFTLEERSIIYQISWWNGPTASGNIDAGIYDRYGNKIITTGSTVQTGATTIQLVDITDTPLAPGYYFMAITIDNTTGNLYSTTGGNNPNLFCSPCYGYAEMLSAFPLPTTITFGKPSGTWHIWAMALHRRAVI